MISVGASPGAVLDEIRRPACARSRTVPGTLPLLPDLRVLMMLGGSPSRIGTLSGSRKLANTPFVPFRSAVKLLIKVVSAGQPLTDSLHPCRTPGNLPAFSSTQFRYRGGVPTWHLACPIHHDRPFGPANRSTRKHSRWQGLDTSRIRVRHRPDRSAEAVPADTVDDMRVAAVMMVSSATVRFTS